MIQQTDRPPQSGSGLLQASASAEGPETWGQWAGRRHYSLEVVQHPLRARMCGFGDKDRRPLAPAAVAKMVVRREDNSIVDVDDVDSSFFLVTVDLWSGDGKQEMNLVLHPSTAERYVSPNMSNKSSARRRNTSSSQLRSGNQTPASSSTATPSQPSNSGNAPGFSQTPAQEGANPYPVDNSPSEPTPSTWGYPPPAPSVDRTTSFPPPVLPSIGAFSRSAPGNNPEPWVSGNSQDAGSYRAWSADVAYRSVNNPRAIDPALRNASSSSDNRENSGWTQTSSGYISTPNSSNTQADQSSYGPGPFQPPYPNAAPYPQDASGTSPPSNITRQPANYTRTLVGPLSANACRLLDEHRKEGIFFLFQDLSVRTEGTFRLRMRLMNIGASPAPESGSARVHNEVSPVLAQTFTDSFTVYSAKRFPGVPDTTALSIAFGNQGQKLPLRNRHGTTSKRRRRGGSESEEDSDEP